MSADPIEVTVRGMAAGGDGVASLPDGRTVFVPRAATGDRLRLRELRLFKRYARGEIETVLEPGPNRVDPPCPHYTHDRCGSCQLMHLAPAAQRAAKGRIIGDALRRIGKLDIDDPEVVAAPAELGYRAKVTFTLRDGRLGYHRLGEAEAVFDVQECLLAEPQLQALFTAVSKSRSTLPLGPARIVMRRDREHRLHVIVRTPSEASAWGGAAELAEALKAVGMEAVLWWHPDGGQPRAMAGSDDPWPATVFEQVNPAVGAMARMAAIEELGGLTGLHAWDLYAGIGETTRELFARGASVESVESDAIAVRHAEHLGPAGPRRHAARVEEILDRLRRPAVVVTNPPRTGMVPEVVAAIAATRAARVAYLSCDPATLARDLVGLTGSYLVKRVLAFDQFPQTSHVECLVILEHR